MVFSCFPRARRQRRRKIRGMPVVNSENEMVPEEKTTTTKLANGGGTSDKCNAMKEEVKTVVIIGNGPSAISLSFMLSGNVPFYLGGVSDEYLHKRLTFKPDETIFLQDIEELATGCEGRSNNPVSVFFDVLNHPDADAGKENPSLLEWKRRPDMSVDHVVLGKGNPGGCWESLEGNVQTVSLGNWMELPDLSMRQVNGEIGPENRVNVSNVAKYYQEYIRRMDLEQNFLNHSLVTSVKEVTECDWQCNPITSKEPASETLPLMSNSSKYSPRKVSFNGGGNALFDAEASNLDDLDEDRPAAEVLVEVCSCSSEGGSGESSGASSVSSSAMMEAETLGPLLSITNPVPARKNSLSSTPRGIHILNNHGRLCNFTGSSYFDECSGRDGIMEDLAMDSCCSWDPIVNPQLFCSLATSGYGSVCRDRPASVSRSFNNATKYPIKECFPDTDRLFEVQGYTSTFNIITGEESRTPFKYLSKNVVLATGSYDFPNRVNVEGEDLPYVLHSLSELEKKISEGSLHQNSDPVLVVGAGLSAADAVIMLRSQGLPVVHAFRRQTGDPKMIFKMLPKALYPEYHGVYNLMKGDEADGKYVSMPEHHIMEILPDNEVVLHMDGDRKALKVSHLVILVGSSPDLSFLEPKLKSDLGILKDVPINRNNPVDIDLFTNEAVNVPGVYAMGPLVGDNFVRFLQGGALAITSHVMKKQREEKAQKRLT